MYPACLEINGIGDRVRTQVAGGFGVIYQGSLLGRTVALKKLKDREQDYDKLIKVFSTDFNQFTSLSLHRISLMKLCYGET